MSGPTLVPAVFYKEPLAALKWLQGAFGFEVASVITDPEGRLAHSELTFRGGALNVGGEWEGAIVGPARMRSPASVEGINTQFVRIHLEAGLDEHCEHARAAGARILDEPTDQFYGSRTYRAMDPEGHVWNFSQEVRVVSGEEMEKATGLKIHTSLEGV
ncbi:MAG TPA: VOC family protein [Phenylobacterium sp.]